MDIEQQRQYLAGVDRTRTAFLRATGRLDPFAEKVKGAIFAMVAPRLALDAHMPDLDDAVAGVDRSNFRARRRHIGDAVRRAVRGKLGRDADIEDIEQLLAALEEDRDTSYDSRYHGRDAEPVERPGYSQPEPPEDDPFGEAEDFLDSELESMRRELGEDNYRRLRAASDRRHHARGRRRARDDEPSPYESFDHRRTARDSPPDFPGVPRPGGSMVEPRDVGAKDRRQHFRKFGQDSALSSFDSRFKFTQRAITEDRSRIPGRALEVTPNAPHPGAAAPRRAIEELAEADTHTATLGAKNRWRASHGNEYDAARRQCKPASPTMRLR
jgi:hypothetical protein